MSGAVPVNTRRRDWFRILRDLTGVGLGYSAVGRKCNRDPTTVRMWAEGSEPKESDARIVLALYAKYCPEKYAEHQREFELRATGERHRVVIALSKLDEVAEMLGLSAEVMRNALRRGRREVARTSPDAGEQKPLFRETTP